MCRCSTATTTGPGRSTSSLAATRMRTSRSIRKSMSVRLIGGESVRWKSGWRVLMVSLDSPLFLETCLHSSCICSKRRIGCEICEDPGFRTSSFVRCVAFLALRAYARTFHIHRLKTIWRSSFLSFYIYHSILNFPIEQR
jgi:hypothetical protein